MYSMLSRHLQRISNVFFMSLFSLFKVLRETSLADSNTTPQGARRGMGGGMHVHGGITRPSKLIRHAK